MIVSRGTNCLDVKKIKLNFFALFNKNNLVGSLKMLTFATDLEI